MRVLRQGTIALRTHGLAERLGRRSTRQREAVYEYLRGVHHHPTAEDVYLAVKRLGIHREKRLPRFAGTTFESWARRSGRIAKRAGGEAVLFQTCYVQHNAPELGRDTLT